MKSLDAIIVLITAATVEEAKVISRTILHNRLAACVNMIPRVASAFWWDGDVQGEKESLLIVKTLKKHLPRVIKEVKEVHSYSVPEIIALPIVAGNEDYLEWLAESTGQVDPAPPSE